MALGSGPKCRGDPVYIMNSNVLQCLIRACFGPSLTWFLGPPLHTRTMHHYIKKTLKSKIDQDQLPKAGNTNWLLTPCYRLLKPLASAIHHNVAFLLMAPMIPVTSGRGYQIHTHHDASRDSTRWRLPASWTCTDQWLILCTQFCGSGCVHKVSYMVMLVYSCLFYPF
jgi:hypothetical protein